MPRLRQRQRRDEPPRRIGASGRPDKEVRCWKCGKLLMTCDALMGVKFMREAMAVIRCPKCNEDHHVG